MTLKPSYCIMAHKESLGQDAEGRYRRYLGWKHSDGKMVQHLFRLGKDRGEAEKRNLRLEALWRCVEERWQKGPALETTFMEDFVLWQRGEKPTWNSVLLGAACAIAKGETTYLVPRPTAKHLDEQGEERSYPMLEIEYADYLGQLNRDFPVISWRAEDEQVYAKAQAFYGQAFQNHHEQARRVAGLLATPVPESPNDYIHKALDAYGAYIAEKYKDRPSNRPQQQSIILLKKHTEDFGLNTLDADRIETWLANWCNRPVSQETGKPLAITTCRNTMIVMRQFLRWLNRSPQFHWTLPGSFSFPRCKIAKTPADRVKKRAYFKLEELTTIWQYAKPWDRALILLALNCGFSKREIATLQPGEIIERNGRSYISRHRTKTDVYAEWVLWPETLEALAYLKQFQNEGTEYVVVNRVGNSMTKGTKKGNENQVIKNHWDHIFKRIHEDHPDFYKLPFKHLRKTGATRIRHMHVANAAELASMYLSHGEKADSQDQLLPVYTSRPWKKLHKVLLRLRKKLLPVFTSVEKPWDFATVRTSPGTVAKVKELRNQGKKLKEIAAEVGLHWVTVGKICRQEK